MKSLVSVVKDKGSQSFDMRHSLLRLISILADTVSSSFLKSFLIVLFQFLQTWIIEWPDWVLTRLFPLTISWRLNEHRLCVCQIHGLNSENPWTWFRRIYIVRKCFPCGKSRKS
jgi:hypothetical protein